MKQKFLVYTLLNVSLYLFYGCKLKDDGPIIYPTYDLSELKQYSFFKEGTYWIYKDSLTGIEDCVFVNYSMEGIDTSRNDDGSMKGIYQDFEYHGYSSLDSCTYGSFFGAYMSSEHPTRHRIIYFKEKNGPPNGWMALLLYPPEVGNTYYLQGVGAESTTIGFYPTYQLDTFLFHSVVKTFVSKDYTQNNQHSNYYIAKDVGIIRKEFIDSNKVWKLVNYKIN